MTLFHRNKKAIEKVIKGPKVTAAVKNKAEKVRAYWQSIAPVFDPSDPREHRTVPAKGAPGAYRDSITVRMGEEDGKPRARVVATDFKARWIEYGSSHMPEYAPLAKVKAKFRK